MDDDALTSPRSSDARLSSHLPRTQYFRSVSALVSLPHFLSYFTSLDIDLNFNGLGALTKFSSEHWFFLDSFMQPNMSREQGRTPLQQHNNLQQQQQQSANGFGQQNPVLGNMGASLGVQPAQTRSPQTIAPVQTPDKNWGWEEKSAAPEPATTGTTETG